MKNSFSLFFLLFTFVVGNGQAVDPADSSDYPHWIYMMQDPKANFFETQKAFEKYWLNRPRDKGDGWKIFKRWEYQMSLRVDEYGNKPAPDHVLNEYMNYFNFSEKSGTKTDKDYWKEVGPVDLPSNGTGQPNGLGRINCIGFHPTNVNIFYAGAPAGGLWKTEDHGLNWDVLTDTLPTLGVSSVVVDYNNPSRIYIGTGDQDGGDSPGLGVWKSVNAGVSWIPWNTGMGNRVVGKIVINHLNANTLLAATNGGIYKSTNAGANWVRKSSNTSNYKDLAYKPGDTSIVYAIEGGSFYRSIDGGENWVKITAGLPTSTRIVIGVSPANANYVHLVLCNQRTFQGFYTSTNSGANFTMMSNSPNIMDYSNNGSGTSGQAYYDLCVAVDHQNVNTIYVGGVNIFKSTNGGQTWTINAHWTGSGAPDIHADQHALSINPLNNRIYSGNDGGVYYTSNGGSDWNDISDGLAIAQIYKIGQSVLSQDLVINGYQDNGTAVFDGSWRTEIGGDGMECIVDPSNDNYMYGALYYGDIRRSTNNGASFSGIASSITETGEWVTPYILKENDPSVMFAGFKNVWVSTNVKASSSSSIAWAQISNSLSGTNAQGIKVLENSKANNSVLFISREDSKLFRSDNINSANPTYKGLPLPTATWPKSIETHPTDLKKVWITQSNNVYYSSDTGKTWTDISGSLPNISMNSIVFDTSSGGDLYVASDLGVFYKGSTMTNWVPYNSGMPYSIPVTELEIYYGATREESRIKAATYGRGLWSAPLYTKPETDMTVEDNQLCVGQNVQFTNTTEGTYTDLLWTFQGGTPSTSNLDNPIVTYNSKGTFNVKLKVWNSINQDSLVNTGYIIVDSIPVISVNPSTATISSGDSITLKASGATSYIWTPTTGLNTSIGQVVIAYPSVTTTYIVNGTNSFCPSTAGQSQSTITVIPSGIESGSFEQGNMSIRPNPASDYFEIDWSNFSSEAFTYTLFDNLGKVLMEKENRNIGTKGTLKVHTESINSGMYFLRIKSNEEQLIFRLVISH